MNLPERIRKEPAGTVLAGAAAAGLAGAAVTLAVSAAAAKQPGILRRITGARQRNEKAKPQNPAGTEQSGRTTDERETGDRETPATP